MIRQISNDNEKVKITKLILSALPEWFADPKANNAYAADSAGKPFFASFEKDRPVGFIYLKETGADTVELYVMGVLKQYQRCGIGQNLFANAKEYAIKNGYSFMQVKTVQMGRYKSYDTTNLFYKKMGFKELEVFPHLWDKNNPCQIYIMALGKTK